MGKYSKLLGGLIGSLTPSGVVALCMLFGVDIPTNVAAGIVAIVAWIGGLLGVYAAPKNKYDKVDV